MGSTETHRKKTLSSLPYLPQEIITEILLWFPVKTLSKFKCVSKSLNSIIANPQFIKSHLQIQKAKPTVILGYTEHPNSLTFYMCSLDPLTKYKSLENEKDIKLNIDFDLIVGPDTGLRDMVGSCNGLCCIRIYGGKYLIIWNPSTRKSQRIPPDNRIWVNSSFPNTEYDESFGFAYDEFSDDYKVIQVMYPNPKKLMVRVYSLRANSWTEIQRKYSSHVVSDPQRIAFVCGNFHWLALRKKSCIIVSYNLKTETLGELKLPYKTNCKGYESILAVLKGCLCSIHRCDVVDIWIMNEYGVQKSWKKIGSYCPKKRKLRQNMSNIEMELDGVEDNGVFLHELRRLGIWNAKDGICRHSRVPYNDGAKPYYDTAKPSYEYCDVVPYVESLVAPTFVQEKQKPIHKVSFENRWVSMMLESD